MLTTKQEPHHHKFELRTFATIPYDKSGSVRHILFRKCECGIKQAYDLVAEKPTG